MKSLFHLFALAMLTGCSTAPHIPPGSAVSWTHTGNYGPFQDRVVATAIEKQGDGTFKVGHYDGFIGWLGFGPHDVVEGLVIAAPAVASQPAAISVPLPPPAK